MQEVGADGKVTATVNNDATKAALQRLKDMRWQDGSMGSTFDYAWGTINQAFAVGPGRHVHRRLRPVHRHGPEQQPQARRLRRHHHPARELADRRRARRWDAGRGQRRDPGGRARRGRELDRLLLHAEAPDPGRRRGRRAGAQGQQPAGRRPGAADLRQGDLRRLAGMDQGVHQRPHQPDDAVHLEDLRSADRDRADGAHPGALRGPRPRRAGRPHRQERRHRRPARCRPTSRSRPSSTPAEHRSHAGPGDAGARLVCRHRNASVLAS